MRSLVPTVIVVAAIVTACGGSAAPTPIPAITPGPSPAVAAVAPSDASIAASLAPSAVATTLTADPQLEAQIPLAVQGVTLEVISLTAAEYLARSPDSQLEGMIQSAALDPSDVSLAIGVGGDGGTVQLAIAAFRFPGIGEQQLADVFVAALAVGADNRSMYPESLSGREVLVVQDPAAPELPTYLVIEGDLARMIQATEPGLAVAAVDALP